MNSAAYGESPRPLRRVRKADDAGLFRLLVQEVVDYAIFLLTPDGHVASWNAGAARLKGYTAEEIIGQSFEAFYTPEDRLAGRPARVLATARSQRRMKDEGWRVRKDGSRFWAEVVITALHDETGTLRGFAKVTRDISDRRVTDEQLRQSEVRYRTLVASIKDYAIFLLSPEGIILTWNEGAARIKGYTAEEIIGQSFEVFYPAAERARGRPQRLLAAARRDGRVEDEAWRVRKDGTQFWADVVLTAMTDADGQLTGFAKVTRDLTERRQAELERATRQTAERAAERLGRLQSVTASLGAAIGTDQVAEVLAEAGLSSLGADGCAVAISTADGSALHVAYARGYDADALSKQVFERQATHPLASAWQTGQPSFGAHSAPRQIDQANAARLPIEPADSPWVATPLLAGDTVLGVLGLTFVAPRPDDREARAFLLALGELGSQAIARAAAYERERHARAEAEAAVQAQDEFLSIASHELRTPVAAVKATAQLAQRALQRNTFDAATMTRHMHRIVLAADRLGTLIEDLLDVSRLRTGQVQLRRQTQDLRPLVEEIVGRYQTTEPERQFELVLPETPLEVHIDPLRLEQVLDNLLSNAVKYSPGGGSIEVRAAADGEGVTLTVTDHGIGLPVGQQTRIFEAFGRATNAAAEQIPGLGLGLAICRQLIEAHGGQISASSPGEHQGTTVAIWLPTGGSPDDSTPAEAPAAP